MRTKLDKNTMHGECLLRLRKPCFHCRKVEQENQKRFMASYHPSLWQEPTEKTADQSLQDFWDSEL